MIAIDRLEVRTPGFALGPLSLQIEPGSYVVVLGRSGSGKTLLLEAIAGIRVATSGTITLGGRDVTRLAPEARAVGYVPQGAVLFPHLDVAANIAFSLRMAACHPAVIRRRVSELAAVCGVTSRLGAAAATLSGGERQRVALARALARTPSLLLLDEPLAALDAPGRAALRETLRRLHAETGTTTVHVTHDLDEAAALGDTIVVLHAGQLLQHGALEHILRRPAHPEVAALCGARNLLRGRLEPGGPPYVLGTAGGLRITAARAPAGARLAVIAPDDIVLSRTPPEATSAVNRFTGPVRHLAPRPPVCYVTIETGAEPLTAVVLERSARTLGLAEGVRVHASVKASAVHLL